MVMNHDYVKNGVVADTDSASPPWRIYLAVVVKSGWLNTVVRFAL